MSSVYEDSICYTPFKKYDSILNDKSENFDTKVSSLIEVWSSIAELNLSQFDIRYVIQIIDWAKLHALNIVLTGEWRSTKESFRNSLLESIEKAQNSLASVNDAFASRCQKLADVVKKPWEDPVLANLIQEKDAEIGSKEIEFFCVETAYLVSVRLKKLCENHCEDLALNLVTNFLNYKKLATVKNFNLNATETQLWFIFDIYIALLYKFQDKTKILQQFEELQLGEGVQLIKRFAKKRVKISKIWRNCHKIAIFGSRFFMSRALMKYTDEYKEFLTELLKTYLALSNTESLLQEFVLSVRNITNLADAAGLCVMCEVIHREAADRLRVFAIEMYIRALTTDMNELERLKHVNEEDTVKLTTSRLANTFTNLADLLDDHVKVARECVLTAFSLEPTKDRLKRIEELAKRSGFPVLDTGQEWKCRLHPPILPSDDLAWVCTECGEWMCKPELTAPLQMNMALHEALQESVLGISEALCDDLVVCLSNPRYQILSWLLTWGDLYRLCILYLNDPEKTKNFVTELKFVDVDYSMFEHIKREPVDEFTGIEKGYEQYLDLDFVSDEETSSVSEDSMSHDRSMGLGSDGTGEPYLALPQPKSDPITLKSLRMFRPNLKRKKEDSDGGPDEKTANQMSGATTSSLESYLSSPQYHNPVNNKMYSSFNNPIKLSNSIYLPQTAGVTYQNTKTISAACNSSSFGYTSPYAAKPFEIPKQFPDNLRIGLSQADARVPSSYSTNSNSKSYINNITEGKKTATGKLCQPANATFSSTTNLGSATSTSYISNIIRSTLSYGVPKVSLTESNATHSKSPHFGSVSVASQGLFSIQNKADLNSPKQCAPSYSTITPRQTISHESFATPPLTSQNPSSRQDSFSASILTNQISSSQVNSTAADLEALLNDIDTNKFETDSKNGVAATLLQLGGQVAKNQNQSIQVQHNLSQNRTKLTQETSSSSGTNGDRCKTSPNNRNKPGKSNRPGPTSDQIEELLCKRQRSVQVINDKISPFKTTARTMELRVRIPRMNLEKYFNPNGKILDKAGALTQKSVPIGQDNNKIKISSYKAPAKQTRPQENMNQCPPEVCLRQLSVQIVPLTFPFSTPEHSTLQRDKSPLPKEKYPLSPCQREQCSMPQKPQQQEVATPPAVPLPTPESQHETAVHKKPPSRRLEPVIIIQPLRLYQDKQPSLKEDLILDQYKASISLVKNKEFSETICIPPSLQKVGANSPVQVHRTGNNLISPKKFQTTCIPADFPKIIIPTITDCDKDRKVQTDNQKTDVEMTENAERVDSSPEVDVYSSASRICSMKTDEQVFPVIFSNSETYLDQYADKLEASSTPNVLNSIIVNKELASDKIRIENKTNTSDSEMITEVLKNESNNKEDIITLAEGSKANCNEPLIENHHALHENEIDKIVNTKLSCDNKVNNIMESNKDVNHVNVTTSIVIVETESKTISQENTKEGTSEINLLRECSVKGNENSTFDNTRKEPKFTEVDKPSHRHFGCLETKNNNICDVKTPGDYMKMIPVKTENVDSTMEDSDCRPSSPFKDSQSDYLKIETIKSENIESTNVLDNPDNHSSLFFKDIQGDSDTLCSYLKTETKAENVESTVESSDYKPPSPFKDLQGNYLKMETIETDNSDYPKCYHSSSHLTDSQGETIKTENVETANILKNTDRHSSSPFGILQGDSVNTPGSYLKMEAIELENVKSTNLLENSGDISGSCLKKEKLEIENAEVVSVLESSDSQKNNTSENVESTTVWEKLNHQNDNRSSPSSNDLQDDSIGTYLESEAVDSENVNSTNVFENSGDTSDSYIKMEKLKIENAEGSNVFENCDSEENNTPDNVESTTALEKLDHQNDNHSSTSSKNSQGDSIGTYLECEIMETENVEITNVLEESLYSRKGYNSLLPIKDLQDDTVNTSDYEIGKNILIDDITITHADNNIPMEIQPTVKEIKENILQSIRDQEVIKMKSLNLNRTCLCKCTCRRFCSEDFDSECNCREEIKIRISLKHPLKYVKYWHNYCGGSKVSQLNSKLSTEEETEQIAISCSKSAGNSPKITDIEYDLCDVKDQFLLFTDECNESYADLNKENIKCSSVDSTIDETILSIEELDNEVKNLNNNKVTSSSQQINFDFSYLNSNKSDKKSNNNQVKKYSNRHKRKHENVPCFKMDQEKDTSNGYATDHNFKPKELSVVLNRLPRKVPNRAHRISFPDSISILKQRLREKIRNNADVPFCVLYKKDKQSSPLLDSNIPNQVIVTKIKRPDFRNVIEKNDTSRKKINCPKGSILKKKSHFSIKKPRKQVQFPPELATNERAAKSMFKNVPGLNDFSEVRPRNTEHVVNVVQVSGSRSSNGTNQNTQTSTQVTPHIQRIGQPKLPDQRPERLDDKSEQSPSSSRTTNADTVKPSTSQSSTLINILSGQLKPGQKTSATSRQPPFINILSQQILKQPNNKPNFNRSTSNHNKNDKTNSDDPNEKTGTVIKVEPEETVEVQTSNSVNTNLKIITSTPQSGGAATSEPTSTQGGTILQFICKSSSLPKFQQAFGKTVYQSSSANEGSTENPPTTTSSAENSNQTSTATVLDNKKIATKAIPVNVQPITGNVIFRGQVPVGQTVSLIPPGSNTRQLFRITGSTHEQISLVKETVIQNKMSALLAAALQGKPKITEQNGELVEEYSATRITLCRPGAVPPNATRIVKPVQLQIPANVIRAPQPNLSSTTLEQLREFDMVYKQVKERSNNPAQPETTTQSTQESPQQQRISFTYVNQVQKYTQLSPVVVVSSYSPIQQTVSPALNVTCQSGTGTCLTQVSTVAVPKVAVKTSKGKNIKSPATKTSPTAVPTIPKPQQKPQEDEHTTQRIFDILAEYAEQLRNSPDLNNKPAPRRRSNPPTNPSSNTSGSGSSKKKKKKSSSSTTSNLVETDNEDLTMGSEDSSGGNVVQLSMTDEEQSESASITPPETNLEPATSSTPTPRPLIMTDTSNQPRNVIIADSSVGEALKMQNTALIMPGSYIMPVSVVKGGQQIAVVSGGSKILTTVPARSGQNMLLFQSFVNQNKKSGGISAVKYSTLQPFSGISSQNVSGLSSQPPLVLPSNSMATVALGQPITLKKIDENDRGGNAELLLTISQPRDAIKVEPSPDLPQPDSSTSLSGEPIQVKIEEINHPDPSSNEVYTNIQKTSSVATSVIASVVKKEQEDRPGKSASMDTSIVKEGSAKQVERVGSVLVNASTSNGPMLSHTNPRYRKAPENVESTTAHVKEFSHSAEKAPQSGTKIFKNNAVYYAIRTKKPVNKKVDSEMQKQAAMEREMRLQKSLSEECEDLGVDEPSTSDLFPEADLLFDSNHSPSYDQTGQRIQVAEVKAKNCMNLFSDDENSGSMRNDLFDYVEYHRSGSTVEQMNGNNASNESTSLGDDTTLLTNCANMSEVTLNSPISPDYTDNSHSINKYKYKYTNRKKGEKVIRQHNENWSEVTEVTSTEDALEIAKDDTPIAIQEETVIDESITTDLDTIIEDKDQSCLIHGCNKSGSRRNSRKPCSCFNGSRSPTPSDAKKRVCSPKSQPSIPNKKPLLSKKR